MFAELPPELRWAISEQGIEDMGPRNVKLKYRIGGRHRPKPELLARQGGPPSRKIPSALLHSCRHSRGLFLARYEQFEEGPLFGALRKSPTGFSDFSRDIFDVAFEPPQSPVSHPAEEIGRIQHLRFPDWSSLSANAKVAAVFSKSTGLTHMTIVLIDDGPDRIIHASPEQTFAYAKAKHGWVPPKYDLEVFGASQRISSGLEAM
ncbi:uncharacterized protein RSE6_04252 [Rhynchosporium secalis]|uniref:2EXR domain-containing protein n=1 Tax=Rhynchosporium secalis TaxID=38038 RepID=A0A1E1M4U6_RHYSE|nr:uncharacterized protein RSE6_04252 [Rhynchosporium secalis]